MEQLSKGLSRLKFSTKSTTQNLYDDVILTPEEQQTAIDAAKEAKYWKLEDERLKREQLQKYQEAARPWSAKEMYEAAKAAAGQNYKIDQHTGPLFQLLSQYFAGDPAFEKDGRSLQKGILIMGPVGVGKTELLKAFRKNKRCCFVDESCNEVERRCRQNGLEFWKTYTDSVPGHARAERYFYQQYIGWLLDDLGTEEAILEYGNKLDPIERILSERYLQKDKVPFFTLHLTTNLGSKELLERYGQRVTSRMREMFNQFNLGGTDRRG